MFRRVSLGIGVVVWGGLGFDKFFVRRIIWRG